VVVLISTSKDTFESRLPFEDALFKSCVQNGYSRRAVFCFSEAYYLWALWRPDSPDAPMLDARLQEAAEPGRSVVK
jgi:hypothetical protein